MIKIINIEKAKDPNDREILIGWVASKKAYEQFEVDQLNSITYKKAFSKKDYKSYLHFVGVMSKFNPYTFFLEKPLIVENLDWDSLAPLIK